MDENPYQAPKEPGATPAKRARSSGKVWASAVATAVNVAICGGYMIHVARRPGGLTIGHAIPPTAMVALSFVGLAIAIWQNRATR
jgi:hypothetical protein